MIQPRIGCYAVYEPPEEGWENWQAQLAELSRDLEAFNVQVLSAPEAVMDLASCERVAKWLAAQDVDLALALIICWSFDHYTVEIQQQCGLPVAIRSIPGIRTGSVVAGQQLNCLLSDLGVEHRLFFGALGNQEVACQTAIYARAGAVQRRLRGARMAVIGRRTEGMTPTAVDEIEILRLFGVRLLNYGLDEFQEIAEQIPLPQADAEWQRFASEAREVTSQSTHGISTVRYYLALKKMAQEFGLQAFSIGSYPQCQGTMCIPIALLNEAGIPTGCEGDVNSSLAMLIMSMLSDAPVHFGEILDVDEQANTIVSSHCGCGSPALADSGGYLLCPVRLANDGVCIRYTARPGAVTYVNLVGRKGNYRLCALQGEAIPTEMVFEGNPLKFRLNKPFREVWQMTSDHGFGHHWMTVYTHAAAELAEFCRLAGIQGVFPDLGIARL